MVKVFMKKGDKELSHEFLFSLLNSEYGFSADEGMIKKTANGKPFIENCPINFSITHSKGNIAVAFSESELGVDEEVIKPVDVAITGLPSSENMMIDTGIEYDGNKVYKFRFRFFIV